MRRSLFQMAAKLADFRRQSLDADGGFETCHFRPVAHQYFRPIGQRNQVQHRCALAEVLDRCAPGTRHALILEIVLELDGFQLFDRVASLEQELLRALRLSSGVRLAKEQVRELEVHRAEALAERRSSGAPPASAREIAPDRL